MKTNLKHRPTTSEPVHRVGKLIVRACEMKGITLSQVSRHLGRNEAFMQQFCMRGCPEELSFEERLKVATYLELSLDQVTVDKSRNGNFLERSRPLAKRVSHFWALAGTIPIMGTSKDGTIDFNAGTGLHPRVVVTPAVLSGVAGAYAVIAPDNTMFPVIRTGAMVFVNPVENPQPQEEVVVQFKNGTGLIRTFVSRTDKWLTVAQLNPAAASTHDISEIEGVHLVVATTRRAAQ